ncbi:hypothetical protein DT385_09490 [Pseudomonas syringae]|nr:hypothetical protein DT385_09490 [Pseudomonas syringae]
MKRQLFLKVCVLRVAADQTETKAELAPKLGISERTLYRRLKLSENSK